jgi:hypothetical protein
VEAALPTTQCFCYGAVTCCPKFISSFHVWFRGQDAALEAHHSRNTHVAGNFRKTMNYLKDNWGLGLGVLFFLIIFVWIYEGSFIDINDATRRTGRVESIFTTRNNNKGSTTAPLKKLAIKIEGIDQFLCYYKLTDDYSELQSTIKTGDVLTVYYKPSTLEYNLDLYQIDKQGETLLDKSSFESKERLAAICVLIIGVGGLGFVTYIRIRTRLDYEKKLKKKSKRATG